MLIMPVGGWKRVEWSEAKEKQVVHAYPQNHNRPTGPWVPSEKSISGRAFSGCLGACALVFIVIALGVTGAITANHSLDQTSAPIVDGSAHGSLARRAISQGRTYSIQFIDEHKNKIPTGTELSVQGTMLTAIWNTDSACVGVLMNRARVQHGDDPNDYCWYHILLTQKRPIDGGDMWPAAALVCDVPPNEFLRVTKLRLSYPHSNCGMADTSRKGKRAKGLRHLTTARAEARTIALHTLHPSSRGHEWHVFWAVLAEPLGFRGVAVLEKHRC